MLAFPSRHTRRHYEARIRRFLQAGLPLSREGVATHLTTLQNAVKGIPEQRLTVAAIRKLAREAQLWGFISSEVLDDLFPSPQESTGPPAIRAG